MSDEKKKEVMRTFVKCLEETDVEKALSLCTDDITWANPFGTFTGKEEVKRYLNWNDQNSKQLKFTETGPGILVQGDAASYEHRISGIMQGEQVDFLAMCTYQFSGDQVKEMKTVFDRLAIAEQATSTWLPKKIVNTLVHQLNKGLD
ncbi:MAG: nuclear transport factor 2 family protein [Bacillota bacterium]|nr:nuclear transport factor 2 family protein [Bacillota bacterium]MDW7678447.1 nuclear transport factor 2 family protein [Bacillota bacterium]